MDGLRAAAAGSGGARGSRAASLPTPKEPEPAKDEPPAPARDASDDGPVSPTPGAVGAALLAAAPSEPEKDAAQLAAEAAAEAEARAAAEAAAEAEARGGRGRGRGGGGRGRGGARAAEEAEAAKKAEEAAAALAAEEAARAALQLAGPSREEILMQIDDLESTIEKREAELEALEAKRVAAEEEKLAREREASMATSPGGRMREERLAALQGTEMEKIYASNANKAEQSHSAILAHSGLPIDDQRELTLGTMPHELAVYKRNLARRPAQQAKLLPLVARRVLQVTQLTAQLRTRYDELQKSWEGSLARREKRRTRGSRASSASPRAGGRRRPGQRRRRGRLRRLELALAARWRGRLVRRGALRGGDEHGDRAARGAGEAREAPAVRWRQAAAHDSRAAPLADAELEPEQRLHRRPAGLGEGAQTENQLERPREGHLLRALPAAPQEL